jgi:hypothetical protein
MLAGGLLIAGLFVALGCALTIGHAGFQAISSMSLAAPSPATQEAILPAQESKLLRTPGWCPPCDCWRVLAERSEQLKAGFRHDEEHRLATQSLCPLYRRPPPVVS